MALLDNDTLQLMAETGAMGDSLEQPAKELTLYMGRQMRVDLEPLMRANARILRAHLLGDEAALDREAAIARDIIDGMQSRLNAITALVTPLAQVPDKMADVRAWAVARVGERVQE